MDGGDRVLAVLGRRHERRTPPSASSVVADALGALGDLAGGHLDAVDGLGPDLVAEVVGRVDDAHGRDPSGAGRGSALSRRSRRLEDRRRDLGGAVAHQVVGDARVAREADRRPARRAARLRRTGAAPRGARPLSRRPQRDQRRHRRLHRGEDRRRVVREHRPHDRLDDVRPNRADHVARGRLDHAVPRRAVLVRVPRRRVERPPVAEPGVHRAQDLRRLVEAAQELVDVDVGRRLEPLPAAVDEHEAGAPRSRGARPRRRRRSPRTRGPRARSARRPRSPEPSATATASAASVVEVVARPSARRTGPGRAGRRRPSASRDASRRATGAHDHAGWSSPGSEQRRRRPPTRLAEARPSRGSGAGRRRRRGRRTRRARRRDRAAARRRRRGPTGRSRPRVRPAARAGGHRG